MQPLAQGRAGARPDEARALALGPQRAVRRREVLLHSAGQPRVFARSATAQAHARGPWRALRGLGQRPLADVLFQAPSVGRSPLQFARLTPQTPLHRQVCQALAQPQGVLWARRSVFKRRGARLLVMEVFLPQLRQLPAPGAHRWTATR